MIRNNSVSVFTNTLRGRVFMEDIMAILGPDFFTAQEEGDMSGFASLEYPDTEELILKFLSKRGLDEQGYAELESISDIELRDVRLLARKLHEAKVSKKPLVIIPDFDTDGITSGVLGYAGLKELGFNVELYIPDPERGYGFDDWDINCIIDRWPDVVAILTCDTGVSCLKGVKFAKENKCMVLVTDHHTEDASTTVRDVADVVVDPCGIGEEYPMKSICGAHVLWQCLRTYTAMYRPDKVEAIEYLRVFAGIGTVSDMMLLQHENRQLVRDAVSVSRLLFELGYQYIDMFDCCPEYRAAFEGLLEVILLMSKHGKIKTWRDLNETIFGFYIAPMFNAAKRMGYEMEKVFRIFTETNVNPIVRADWVEELWKVNETRKERVQIQINQVKQSEKEGRQMFAPHIYVINPTVNSGIVGLIASSIMSTTKEPVLVVRALDDGSYKGSGRCPVWYPFLTRTSSQSLFAAGHEGAFGVGFNDKYQMKDFSKFFDVDIEVAKKEYKAMVDSGEIQELPPYDITIDDNYGDVGFDVELLHALVDEFEEYRPFGPGFAEPRVRLSFNVGSRNEIRGMTPDGEGGFVHGKFQLPSGISGICFGQGNQVVNASLGHHDVVGALEINTFAGRDNIQVRGDLDPEVLNEQN